MSGVAKTEHPPASHAAATEETGFRAESWLGRVIDGRYRVLELLGEGGMGAVFLAEHLKLQKKVALKIILPQFAGDGELAERFAREAMASASLDHPNIASALDYGFLRDEGELGGGGAYLVMQYVRGRSLRRAMQGEPTWQLACEIGAQIADALAAAHAQRIVHRDLKPENVILEPRDDGSELAKVLDFGVARVVSDDATSAAGQGPSRALTRVGTVIGTPGYMAPEQALGELVDQRADLYALGVVLWEMIARRPLFPDDDLTVIVTKQLTTEPARLASVVPDVPVELDDLVMRLLAKARDDRPSRAGEVRDVLKRLALGATLEHKMLSGEIAVPMRASDASGSHPVAQVTSGRDATGPLSSQVAMHPPSSQTIALPPALGRAADVLQQPVGVGPLKSLPTSLLVVGCATPLVLAGLVLLLVLALGGEETPPVASVTPEAPAEVAPTPSAPEPSTPAPAPQPPVASAPPRELAPIPLAIARDVSTMLDSAQRSERTSAAQRLRAASLEGAPPFVAEVVTLELADRCPDRRNAVRRLAEIGDPRAMPPLDRLHRDRRGCGFLNTQDCHRCLRRDLRAAREALSGSGSE